MKQLIAEGIQYKILKTNYMRVIQISMIVRVPDEITEDILSDIFVGWVEGNGWICGGAVEEVPFAKGDFKAAMKRVLQLMNKGEGNLTEEEMKEIKSLALKCQQYERGVFPELNQLYDR